MPRGVVLDALAAAALRAVAHAIGHTRCRAKLAAAARPAADALCATRRLNVARVSQTVQQPRRREAFVQQRAQRGA